MSDMSKGPGRRELIEAALVWLAGAVAIPAGLVGFIVWTKDVTLYMAIAGSEFFSIGAGIAGASLALELIMTARGAQITAYRMGLLLLCLANALFFIGTIDVSESGAVLRNLNPSKSTTSINLLIATIVLSVWAPVRKVRADAELA